ncbi:MAG: prolyl oligopeptidase family serine peptidase [Gammaproteobacteria bacterium]
MKRLWTSPLGAEAVAAGARRLAEPQVGSGAFYWLESLPAEGGRTTLMSAAAGCAPHSLLADPWNVASRVNEYGGGAYTLAPGGPWFVNGEDQALCRIRNGAVERLFRAEGLALGDLAWDRTRDRVLAAAEDRGAGTQSLVAIDAGGRLATLAAGADFYAAPRVSPDGARLAWLEWDAPDMPWDATRLMLASVSEAGELRDARLNGGGAGESLAQPEWSPDGNLYVVSDRDGGYWNLYRARAHGLVPVRRARAECARPAFAFAQRLYAFTPTGGLVLAEAADGLWRCLEGRREGGEMALVLAGQTEVAGLHAGPAGTAILAGGAATPLTLFVRLRGEPDFRVLATSLDLALAPGFISRPEPVGFATGQDGKAHGLYYAPAHPGERTAGPAPLRVRCHGGPTSTASSALDPKTLYWTSRGFAVLELNYRGSTGYGRGYREALYGQWGVADATDACAAARELVARGLADPERMAIAGGSAGGLTVLNALAGETPYAAGASHYGVADLTALTRTTHRFEARYGEQLVGPWPAARATYEARSPFNRVGEIARPVIFFQGLDDPVVPPAQSREMARALAARGIAVALETFPGERHGFRRAETISRVLEAELAFYVRAFGLETVETLPVPRYL